MGDEDDGLLIDLPDPLEVRLQEVAGLRIECTEGLVHQKDARIDRERSRKPDALLHAARKLARVALLEALEADHVDIMLDRVLRVCLLHAPQFEPEADIVLDRPPRQEGEGLEDDGAFPAGPDDRLAVDQDLAADRRG